MIKQSGFTLIELMITLVILAVVIGLAAPSFNSQAQRARTDSAAEELRSALLFARSEAVKRAQRVSVCVANAAATACDAAGSWENGWIVFVDTAATDAAATPVVGNVLKQKAGLPSGLDVAAAAGADSRYFIRYAASGMLARLSNLPVDVTFVPSACVDSNARQLTVQLSGTAAISSMVCP
ncbi:GspH/FimT family pseudopilin [Simiduia curdlanivorans]|uniref:Type II secretion system protein H n=1 Tax=Simiduia curdlanivorans TaxID=1492769 RepID=A0ABV8VAS0_9GAMM|nr:GspH/FimT family pseudopilin [Simiduia curdlanivorans]MDN3639508.1 GspH/FimT family pseudopilin [Simiduia curdlanivorans]